MKKYTGNKKVRRSYEMEVDIIFDTGINDEVDADGGRKDVNWCRECKVR